MKRTLPFLFSRKSNLVKLCVRKNPPRKFVAICASKVSGVTSKNVGSCKDIPALLTKQSTPSSILSASLIKLSSSVVSCMSSVRYLQPILSAVDLNVCSFLPDIKTDAPSATNFFCHCSA